MCEFLSFSLCPKSSSVTVSSPGGTAVGQSTSDTQSSPVLQFQSQSSSLSSGHTLGTVISDTVQPSVMTMEHSTTIHFIFECVGLLQRHISFHNFLSPCTNNSWFLNVKERSLLHRNKQQNIHTIMTGTKVLTLGILGSLIPTVKSASIIVSYHYIHKYVHAWITILLGWALEPSQTGYSQKRHWDYIV